jgi:hypothetical protein
MANKLEPGDGMRCICGCNSWGVVIEPLADGSSVYRCVIWAHGDDRQMVSGILDSNIRPHTLTDEQLALYTKAVLLGELE